jgi:D-alanyl-D-alanine carboxypeptidase
LIERMLGDRYETYVLENVLRPLGAAHSGYALPGDAAAGYLRQWSIMGLAAPWLLDRRSFGPNLGGFRELRPFCVDGAPYGGLVGPAADMLLLGQAMLSRGSIGGAALLLPEFADAALAPMKSLDGAMLPIGLGWHLGKIGEEQMAFHLGGGGGFRSELRIYPRLNYAIAIIANETSFDTAAFARLIVQQ